MLTPDFPLLDSLSKSLKNKWMSWGLSSGTWDFDLGNLESGADLKDKKKLGKI